MSGYVGGIGGRSGHVGRSEVPGGYEEGTWTFANQWMTATNNHQASYTKIGNIVHVFADATLTGASDSSQTGGRFQGFPFVAATGLSHQYPFTFIEGPSWQYSYRLDANATTMYVYQASGVIAVRATMNGKRVKVSGTYITN